LSVVPVERRAGCGRLAHFSQGSLRRRRSLEHGLDGVGDLRDRFPRHGLDEKFDVDRHVGGLPEGIDDGAGVGGLDPLPGDLVRHR
jgi:hypothetical protein